MSKDVPAEEGAPAAPANGLPPALMPRWAPSEPVAAVLLLHGGRADAVAPPPRLNLPRRRMRPFGTAVIRATRAERVLVGEVRYRHRGWNGPRQDAAHDARRALAELRRTAGRVPVVLVGHSMGGRAALRVADDPCVRGVVGLAPWCPPEEPVTHLGDTEIVLLHGEKDRVTSAQDSWEYVHRAYAAGVPAGMVVMPHGGHAMLGDARTWHRITTAVTLGLLGFAPIPPEVLVPWPPLRR
ncbi:alpha/beta fold hydrolase [Streptomyces roseoverticillatus]|uniref:alpha/beta fold hydrolase n=1 Tax=Streptomyces roseoverticillatus TaxID=66429 RepID=UPI0033F3B2E2